MQKSVMCFESVFAKRVRCQPPHPSATRSAYGRLSPKR
jgi:hypothetical protein